MASRGVIDGSKSENDGFRSVNDASRSAIDDSRVTLQIVASLVTCDCHLRTSFMIVIYL